MQRSNCRYILAGLLMLMAGIQLNAQKDFEIWLNSQMDETPVDMILSPSGDCVGIIPYRISLENHISTSIYCIGQSGDTMSTVIEKADTTIQLSEIIVANNNPIEYLVCGLGLPIDGSLNQWFAYFARLDASLNILWEKKYKSLLGNVNDCASHRNLLKKKDGGYIHTGSSHPHHLMYILELSETGDSLAYRLYEQDSAGQVGDLIYNHDSTLYLLHTHFAHYSSSGPESQCIEVDFDLNQTKVMYYPRWFEGNMTAKLLPNGNIISASSFFEPFTKGSDDYIAVYKFDSNLNVLNECYFTHPDTNAQPGYVGIDYYHPDYIYAGGTHNHQLGIWIPGPTWIVISLMNQNLEIEYEKYIGGDGGYAFSTLTATPDTGVLVTATWYDYPSQSYQRDVVIMKLGFEDFITSVDEVNGIPVHSAIVYPNPGVNDLSLRTALKNTTFVLFDAQGKVVMTKEINDITTTFDLSALEPGTYIWNLHDGNRILESGKWIKSR